MLLMTLFREIRDDRGEIPDTRRPIHMRNQQSGESKRRAQPVISRPARSVNDEWQPLVPAADRETIARTQTMRPGAALPNGAIVLVRNPA
jgi:hypothetical protein